MPSEEWAEDHGYWHWKCRDCGMAGYTDTSPDCACPRKPLPEHFFCVECNKPESFDPVEDGWECEMCGWLLDKAASEKAEDNYEPPDDPVAWSGGFAPN